MCALNQGEEKPFLEEDAFFIKDKKIVSAKFFVNFSRWYVIYVMFYTTQTTFGTQQRLLVLEILEIVSCGNLTRAIAVLTALS